MADQGESLIAVPFRDLSAMHLTAHIAVDRGERCLNPLLADVMEKHIVAGEGDDMGDAVAHLPSSNDPHSFDGGLLPPLASIDERITAKHWGCGLDHRELWVLCGLFPAVERRFKFRQDLEKVSDKAIIRDLENRSFLILVDGNDDSRVPSCRQGAE